MSPLGTLRHHVTGAIERGEATAIIGKVATHRLVIREPDGTVWLDRYLAVESDHEAINDQADHWKPPYSLAEPGRYRSELYRMGEAKPYSIIG
ncbi:MULTISPECIES: hypothetical protein [unclassified Sphingomonas]|uniref:hypothetical protein n=1 Tax=unclassified Sphingomonas TaxID=196159 RepID=UPI0021515179|nr:MULTISPECIES: hypothetical protein [unclassified Sphingomonas]MCR5870664.1 hypothetical protein [Sphingomonas sp. J344]UUY00998.1 hypothetical protein LRS08_08065 [Sphingomonas sp. J315]